MLMSMRLLSVDAQGAVWTYTDIPSVHPNGQPPGFWIKGHAGAGC